MPAVTRADLTKAIATSGVRPGAAETPGAGDDAAPLVLFDDVELLLDERVGDVERGAAAVPARRRAERVFSTTSCFGAAIRPVAFGRGDVDRLHLERNLGVTRRERGNERGDVHLATRSQTSVHYSAVARANPADGRATIPVNAACHLSLGRKPASSVVRPSLTYPFPGCTNSRGSVTDRLPDLEQGLHQRQTVDKLRKHEAGSVAANAPRALQN